MQPLVDAIFDALKAPTLDEALKPVMDAIGVVDGGIASIVFSTVEGFERPEHGQINDTWWKANNDPRLRAKAIRRYVDTELSYLEDSCDG